MTMNIVEEWARASAILMSTCDSYIQEKAEFKSLLRPDSKINRIDLDDLKKFLATKCACVKILHDADLDGNTANMLIADWVTVNYDVPYTSVALGHGKSFQERVDALVVEKRAEDHLVVVLDHAVDESRLNILCEAFGYVLVIDHHTDTFNSFFSGDLPALVVAGVHSEASSTLLTRSFLKAMAPEGETVRQQCDLLVTITDIYDCYRFGKTYGLPWMQQVRVEEIARCYASYGFRYGYTKIVDSWVNIDLIGEIIIEGSRLLEDMRFITTKLVMKNSFVGKDNKGRRVAIAFHSEHQDTIGARLMQTAKPDYAMVMYVKSDGRIKISFRSNATGADVSEIAKEYGGGGGAQAAGAEISATTYAKFWSELQLESDD